jgi:dolichol-phosphate mannosyltransferase
MIELSVVIPVYKAEKCLEELAERTTAALAEITEDYELILVEDNGGDRSWELIQEVAKTNPRIKGIKFCRNFGQQFALSAGMDFARGNWVVIMDCDLQDQPEEIGKLYDKAREGYDVVLARRVARDSTFLDRFTSKWFYRVFDYFVGARTDHSVGAFRIISRKVVRTFREMPERHRFFGGMIQWMGHRTASIDIPHAPRHSGRSTYTLWRRLDLAVDAIISFSNKPLVLSVRLGFLIVILSLFSAGFFTYRKLAHDVLVEGYTSIIVALFFLGGIIIMNIGIVGIYIGRVYDQVKNRPLYIIEETTFHG